MQTVNLNRQTIQINSIMVEIEWNAECADKLVIETAAEVSRLCREWALTKQHTLHQLIESGTMSKQLINKALQVLFTEDETEIVLARIAQALEPRFEERDLLFPVILKQANRGLDSKHIEKYWFELHRTSITSELMEELKQTCWSTVFGDLQGWILDQAVLGSGQRYCLQQWELKALLLKQIDAAVLFVEQRISSQLLQSIIQQIYQQYDQREEHLRQDLKVLQGADRFAAEQLVQVS